MVTERCRSPVILPWAAAMTLRHCLNSNYSVADFTASVIEDDFFLGVKSTGKIDLHVNCWSAIARLEYLLV